MKGLLHLVSVYIPEEKGVVAQVKSGLAGGEIIGAQKALSSVNLKNKVVTGDAMFVQESKALPLPSILILISRL